MEEENTKNLKSSRGALLREIVILTFIFTFVIISMIASIKILSLTEGMIIVFVALFLFSFYSMPKKARLSDLKKRLLVFGIDLSILTVILESGFYILISRMAYSYLLLIPIDAAFLAIPAYLYFKMRSGRS